MEAVGLGQKTSTGFNSLEWFLLNIRMLLLCF